MAKALQIVSKICQNNAHDDAAKFAMEFIVYVPSSFHLIIQLITTGFFFFIESHPVKYITFACVWQAHAKKPA